MTSTITTSKTKSGKVVQVAVIPVELVDGEGLERMQWLATAIAQGLGCPHYRVVSATGAVVSVGKVAAPTAKEEKAAERIHGY